MALRRRGGSGAGSNSTEGSTPERFGATSQKQEKRDQIEGTVKSASAKGIELAEYPGRFFHFNNGKFHGGSDGGDAGKGFLWNPFPEAHKTLLARGRWGVLSPFPACSASLARPCAYFPVSPHQKHALHAEWTRPQEWIRISGGAAFISAS